MVGEGQKEGIVKCPWGNGGKGGSASVVVISESSRGEEWKGMQGLSRALGARGGMRQELRWRTRGRENALGHGGRKAGPKAQVSEAERPEAELKA